MMSDEMLTPEERAREWGITRTWTEEVFYGDWSFKAWPISSLNLRPEIAYGSASDLPRPIAQIHWRLRPGGDDLNLADLQQRLHTINDHVAQAVEEAARDAEACWKNRQVWLPALDEALVADDDLAEIAIQSLDACGVADTEPLVTALGLWLIGEWRHSSTLDGDRIDWALENLLVVAAEVGWHRGAAAERQSNARASSTRGRRGADALHARNGNRQRKQDAEVFFRSRSFPTKAEAARAINHHFGVVEQVAQRWVREFSHALP